MRSMLMLITTSVGGGVGWWLGGLMGLYPALFLSVVGTVVALYYTRKFMDDYMPA
ncbi:MAG: hypothetical protein KDA22_01895 [Phycisphaerales bacterium]|nr:hypothetical protein [Phycisphaerales bacterium]